MEKDFKQIIKRTFKNTFRGFGKFLLLLLISFVFVAVTPIELDETKSIGNHYFVYELGFPCKSTVVYTDTRKTSAFSCLIEGNVGINVSLIPLIQNLIFVFALAHFLTFIYNKIKIKKDFTVYIQKNN